MTRTELLQSLARCGINEIDACTILRIMESESQMVYVAECRQCVPTQGFTSPEEELCYRWAFVHSARTQHTVDRYQQETPWKSTESSTTP